MYEPPSPFFDGDQVLANSTCPARATTGRVAHDAATEVVPPTGAADRSTSFHCPFPAAFHEPRANATGNRCPPASDTAETVGPDSPMLTPACARPAPNI